jgi:peptidyl-dipeptidase Dcp
VKSQASPTTRKAPTFDNTIVAMERSGQLLTRVSTVFSNLQTANTNDKPGRDRPRDVAEAGRPRDAIYLNDKLYKRVKTLYDKRDKLGLDAESKFLLERYTRTSCARAPSCRPPTRKS